MTYATVTVLLLIRFSYDMVSTLKIYSFLTITKILSADQIPLFLHLGTSVKDILKGTITVLWGNDFN
jgi:hypothetical protein